MKITALVLTLTLTTISQSQAANTVSDALFFGLLEESVGNGSAGVSSYDISSFSVEAAKANLIVEWKESFSHYDKKDQCQYVATIGVRENKKLLQNLISDESIYMQEEVANVFLNALFGYHSKIKFKEIVSVVWDEKSGDSEYCSVYVFDMYTVTGQRLYLDAQNTD